MHLIDTNIAIHLRDKDRDVILRLLGLPARPMLSIISLVELEGGIAAVPALAAIRRARLNAVMPQLTIAGFDEAVVSVYCEIVEAIGFSRSRILDRLIAATAIVNDLTLITINRADFGDIPNLKLEVWPVSAQ